MHNDDDDEVDAALKGAYVDMYRMRLRVSDCDYQQGVECVSTLRFFLTFRN